MLKITTTEDGRSYLESIGMDRIRFLLASAGHTMTIEELEDVSTEEGEE